MLVVGSLNVDLVTTVERHPRPGETVLGAGLSRHAGGKGANQAVAARAAGARVSMIGCVGSDEAGSAYLARLSALDVDASAVRVVAGCPSGHAIVTVDAAGENAIVVVPGANEQLGADDLLPLDAAGYGDVVLVQLEVPLSTVAAAVRHAAGHGARVVLNLAPYAVLPPDVVALADPLVVNEHEALLLADSDALPSSLVVTFGAAGATWDDLQMTGPEVAPADVLDTTGAGDAFCGGLAAALAAGVDRHTALEWALEAGARAVRHHGAQPDAAL